MNVASKIACTLLGAAALAAPGTAYAANTVTSVGVSATIAANCTVSTTAVAFGSVNTLSGSAVDATGGISVACTSGTVWAASAGAGSGTGATFASRKMTSGSDLLNYSLFTDSGRSSVWGDGTGGTSTVGNTGTGSAQPVTIYARIAAGQTSAPTGSYSDTVSVTVAY
jgi:spore coat protein U-like protein